MPSDLQALLHAVEAGLRVRGEELEHLRGSVHDRLVLGPAGVEHPQGVEGQRLAALLGQVGSVSVRKAVSAAR